MDELFKQKLQSLTEGLVDSNGFEDLWADLVPNNSKEKMRIIHGMSKFVASYLTGVQHSRSSEDLSTEDKIGDELIKRSLSDIEDFLKEPSAKQLLLTVFSHVISTQNHAITFYADDVIRMKRRIMDTNGLLYGLIYDPDTIISMVAEGDYGTLSKMAKEIRKLNVSEFGEKYEGKKVSITEADWEEGYQLLRDLLSKKTAKEDIYAFQAIGNFAAKCYEQGVNPSKAEFVRLVSDTSIFECPERYREKEEKEVKEVKEDI